jgi:uncharacterized membrane protein
MLLSLSLFVLLCQFWLRLVDRPKNNKGLRFDQTFFKQNAAVSFKDNV